MRFVLLIGLLAAACGSKGATYACPGAEVPASWASGFVPDGAGGSPPCHDNTCGKNFAQGDASSAVSAVAMTAFQGKPIVVSISR